MSVPGNDSSTNDHLLEHYDLDWYAQRKRGRGKMNRQMMQNDVYEKINVNLGIIRKQWVEIKMVKFNWNRYVICIKLKGI